MSKDERSEVSLDDTPLLSSDGAKYLATPGDSTKATRGSTMSAKSLFLCLVLDNPFFHEDEEKDRVVDEDQFEGTCGNADGSGKSFLSDDDFLLKFDPDDPPIRSQKIPNKFQKIIELLLRLRARGVDYYPTDVLLKIPEAEVAEAKKSRANQFHGYSLNDAALLYSPDRDEIYFKVHSTKDVLLNFAERQGIVMCTNAYSYAGGAGMTYSAELEKNMAASVDLYKQVYDVPDDFLNKKKGWGFRVDVPQKMRLGVRLLREAWGFGGCGIQLDEMKRKKVLVRSYFPLHNEAYLKAYNLDKWSSLKAFFSLHPYKQDQSALVHYFGEQTALYFVWIREYALFLRWAAFFGVITGLLEIVGVSLSLVYAIFGVLLIIWAFLWCRKWRFQEAQFNSMLGQDVEEEQQLVRDEFTPDGDPDPVTVKDVIEMQFDFPVTLVRKPDGTMLQLRSSRNKRLFIRCFITYPVIALMTAIMTGALIELTIWRMSNINDKKIEYAASALSTICGVVFGQIFSIVVPLLNGLENNRTNVEEENQLVIKSFFFYFFSSYFAMGAIMLYPAVDNLPTLRQMSTQMLFISVIKPTIQNIQEICIPRVKAALRKRVDLAGGYCAAFGSLLCCRSLADMGDRPDSSDEGRQLWYESQLEPYQSTSDDFLEITLQFGFMTMFATVLPWAAVAGAIYAALEIRIDAVKLVHFMQRPLAHTARNIGAWSNIAYLLVGLSIVTNSYLSFVLSPLPKKIQLSTDMSTRYLACGVMQYCLIFILIIIFMATGNEPINVSKRAVKHNLLRDSAIRVQLMNQLRALSHNTETFPKGASEMPTLTMMAPH